ncbi:hypothetical protein C0993_011155, partial [Termitomyces sp. T159_Od127]
MKDAWKKEITEFEITHKQDVMKGDFTAIPITDPVLEAPPKLPQPQWDIIDTPLEASWRMHEQLGIDNEDLQKKNDCALLFNGEAQVLSSDKFRHKIEEQAKQKELKAAQKARNAEVREARRTEGCI